MSTIVNVKQSGVTTGVLDKTLAVLEDLMSVTFTDLFGTPHTVYAHKDGPFKKPEDAVAAWENGTLHPFAKDPESTDAGNGDTKGEG